MFPGTILIYKMEGIIVRRVIPSDNSCLFNAVGYNPKNYDYSYVQWSEVGTMFDCCSFAFFTCRYVMEHDKNKAPELRQVFIYNILILLPKIDRLWFQTFSDFLTCPCNWSIWFENLVLRIDGIRQLLLNLNIQTFIFAESI